MHHTKNIADELPERSYQAVDINYGKGEAYVSLGHYISGYRVNCRRIGLWWSGRYSGMGSKIVFVVGIILFLVSLFTGRRRP